jgi:Protein of unknown function (DUF4199)
MKIALKYGLLITLVVVAWVVIVRFVINLGPDSKLNLAAPLLFNLAAFFSIYFGIREHKRDIGDRFTFKKGIKTGAAISLVYATSACLFFFIEFLIAGPRLLMMEAGAQARPIWQVALVAYAGLFFGSLIFGLIYSALCAFFVAKQQRTS